MTLARLNPLNVAEGRQTCRLTVRLLWQVSIR